MKEGLTDHQTVLVFISIVSTCRQTSRGSWFCRSPCTYIGPGDRFWPLESELKWWIPLWSTVSLLSFLFPQLDEYHRVLGQEGAWVPESPRGGPLPADQEHLSNCYMCKKSISVTFELYEIIRNILVPSPSSWHRAPKTLIISYATRTLRASLVLIFGLWPVLDAELLNPL